MLPNIDASVTIKRIAAKEITLFFASPIAYLFLAVFAGVTLFVFFWGESFFSRNISDVRPLFEWMPILLIFLCSTLTMRLWSEERRSGTLEFVLTQALPLWHFVLGKFLGCLSLLIIALLVTLPIPMTVAFIANLDWGPVLAGYIASLMMGAAYLSIGLCVSARSDNQIVSLIVSTLIGSLFYLLGTTAITDFFGHQIGEWLRLIGSGARFDAITRGVIDIRDLYYYLSLLLAFLALNTLMLERERWAKGKTHAHHQRWLAITFLVIANALSANLWLGQLNGLRLDVTQGQQYSISDSTKNYLKQLQEPLLIKGYFSSKTHPLLAPLVPQMRDLMKEYQIAGQDNVRIEFIDPLTDTQQEEEANQKYGIKPVPFQVADRYQSSIVSSYFNIVVQYGDQHHVLGFQDLIEVKARSPKDVRVKLRNPEHDLTRAIKKVLSSYQAGGNLFDTLPSPIRLTAYISPNHQLPQPLIEFKAAIQKVLKAVEEKSSQRFSTRFIDPHSGNGEIATTIAKDFGFKPMAANIFSHQTFYFYLLLESQNKKIQIPLGNMQEATFERQLKAALKRFTPGFTKTVAMVTPEADMPSFPYMQSQPSASFKQLSAFLESELDVMQEDLSDGVVSGEADILLLASPKALSEKALFAIDQFLMKGGTVIAATSPYKINMSSQGLRLEKQTSGLESWLNFHGLTIEPYMVLDQQSTVFPVPVTRQVGGFRLQEVRMMDYPYFPDIREQGLNQTHLITADIPQLTMTWSSPITVNSQNNSELSITPLIESSDTAWLSDTLDVAPKMTQQGLQAFVPQGEQKQRLLGAVIEGRFNSYFAGKSSPLLSTTEPVSSEEPSTSTSSTTVPSEEMTFQLDSIIERAPASARIIVFSSNDFFSDQLLGMTSRAQQSQNLSGIQLIANTIDWSLEDIGLLSIRSRGNFNRTLPPMPQNTQILLEYLNYGLAVLAIIMVAFIQRRRRSRKQKAYHSLLIG